MAVPRPQQVLLSYEAYVGLEAETDTRYEYLDGSVRMMVGADVPHGIVCANLIGLVHARLKGHRCRVVESQTKLRLDALNRIYYPDLMVVCDPLRQSDTLAVRTPMVVAEVLSESTASIDKREKALAYQSLESVQSYLIIDPQLRTITVWSRSDGEWRTKARTMDVELPELGISFPCAEVFDGL